jgi:type I restriction enzyme S subunit
MTALLTDNLPLLAGAPNGIKKLRELILELAVRGKLLPQDPSDEPASELLKRIAEEKVRLVAEGKIKKPKPLEDIAEEEWPFVLPAGWEWSRLGDVSEYIQRGKGPAYVDQSDFRVVSQKCVRWTGLDLQPARFIAPESLVKYESIRFLRSGDILWNSTGTGTIGRACIVEHCSEDEQLVADSHVTVVRPTGLLPVFLWRWIQSPSVQSELEGNASGTTNQIELNTSTVIAHLTPIPPLAEQDRIIAKVDELMALCDRLEAQQADAESAHAQLVQALLDSLTQASDATDFAANWQRLAEHFNTLFTTEPSIDALKQTLLQLAVMGKLVSQDPSDEPASELLKRIAEEKARLVAEGKLKKQKMLADADEEERPFDLPNGWQWVRLGQVVEANTGHAFKSSEYRASGTFVLRVTNINPDGTLDLTDAKYIDPVAANSTYQSVRLEAGEILLVMVGGSLGKIGVVDESCLPAVLNQNMWKIFRPQIVNRDYLIYGLRLINATQLKITNSTHGHLAQGEYLSKLFPLAPEKEQHRIVAKVDQLMALCDQLKTRLTQARQLNEQLASTLVEQAVA